MDTPLIVNNDTQKLVKLCQEVSLEALGTEDAKGFMQKSLPRLASMMRDGFRLLRTWDYSKPATINDAQVKSTLRRFDYTDIGHVAVSTPIGFKGDLPDYVDHMSTIHLQAILDIQKVFLPEYVKQLSVLLNNPEEMRSPRVVIGRESGDRKRYDSVVSRLGDFFVEGNRTGEQPLSAVYPNLSSVSNSMKQTNEINKLVWSKASPKDVANQVKKLQSLADSLLSVIANGRGDINQKWVAEIATRIENMALWIEYYSAVNTRLIDLTSAQKQTEKTLLRL